MGDFSRKHKLKDFITQAKRNGWVTTPDEQKKMECIYKMSEEKDGCTDQILDKVYNSSVWTVQDRELGWSTFIWTRVFGLYTSNKSYEKISKESFDEFSKYIVSEHSQEELDKIHDNVENELKAEEARDVEEAKKGMDKFLEKAFKRGWSESDRGLLQTIYENNELLKKNGENFLDMSVFDISIMQINEDYPQLHKNSLLTSINREIANKNLDSKYSEKIFNSIDNYFNLEENKKLAEQESIKREEARLRKIEEAKQKSFEKFMDKAKKSGWSDDDKDFLSELHDKTHELKNGSFVEKYAYSSSNFWMFDYQIKNNSLEDKRDALGRFRQLAKENNLSEEEKKPVLDLVESAITRYNAEFIKHREAEANKKIRDIEDSFNLGDKVINHKSPDLENEKIKVGPQDKEKQEVEKITEGLLKQKEDDKLQPLSYATNRMEALKNVILADLRQYRARLTLTQSDQMANFVSDKEEGSPEYREMCSELEKGIETLENEEFAPDQINDVINSIKEKSIKYHRAKHGGFGGPMTDNGIERDEISFALNKKLNVYQEKFNNMYDNVYKPAVKNALDVKENEVYKLSIKEVKTKIDNRAQRHNIQIVDTADKAWDEATKVKAGVDKEYLKIMIKEISGLKENQYAEYMKKPAKSGMLGAEMYLIKNAIDVFENKNATLEEIDQISAKLHPLAFHESAKQLACDRVFVNVCKNSEDFYMTYKNIVNKAETMQKENKAAYSKMMANYEDEEAYINHLDEGADFTNLEQKVKNATELLSAKILSDPKNDKLRTALASGTGNINKFNNYISKFVKNSIERTSQKNNESNKHYDDVKELLNTKNLNKKIMEGFAAAEKNAAKQKGAPQANKEMNQIKIN